LIIIKIAPNIGSPKRKIISGLLPRTRLAIIIIMSIIKRNIIMSDGKDNFFIL